MSLPQMVNGQFAETALVNDRIYCVLGSERRRGWLTVTAARVSSLHVAEHIQFFEEDTISFLRIS